MTPLAQSGMLEGRDAMMVTVPAGRFVVCVMVAFTMVVLAWQDPEIATAA